MTNEQSKTQIIFSIYIASELMARGHKVLRKMPNPVKPEFDAWLFEVDETFFQDFEELKGGSRNGRR